MSFLTFLQNETEHVVNIVKRSQFGSAQATKLLG